MAQFGHMDGLENISPGRNLQFIPYGLLSRSRYLDRPGGAAPAMVTDNGHRGGIDAKAVIKDALTLDLTLNPDFSQVESDEPQVTVNQRYEVFFPEQRPFFMENASYFNTPQTLFFSRRIVDPEYGVRLTGKIGRWAIGVLAADDRAPGKLVAADDPLRGQRATDAVVSIQRDFLKDSHLRFFGTDREWASGHNRVGSLDTRLHFAKDWFFTGQAVTSRTRTLDASDVSGNSYYGRLSRSTRRLQYFSAYTDRSPGFRAELVYIPLVDIREFQNQIWYMWWRDNKTLINFGPELQVTGNWDRTGRAQDWEVELEWNMEFRHLTALSVSRAETFELYRNLGFRGHTNQYELNSEWFKWLAMTSSFAHGTGVNYYPGAGYVPFLGNSQKANLGATLRPTPRLRLDETYILSRLNMRNGGPTIYNNHIARSKLNYQLTRELSFRAIFDYNGVLPNASLVTLDRTKRIGCDFLVTYLLHPGTALYVGYTDIYENLELDPSRPPYLRLTGFPDLNTGRQIFVKLSYLFRF